MFDPLRPALVLAPMEGVTDAPMRALQGEAGTFTYAVAEFLRVASTVPSANSITRHVPELLSQGRTITGLPVQIQLLGGDPGRMAETAAIAHAQGASAIDLNFGCPARTVNRHDGGAALLKDPPRIRAVVAAVRAVLPRHVAVSAKLRLGWDRIDTIDETASMAAEGGAAWLTIHGRTRSAGYSPPIYWEPIGRVRSRLGIPIVANGDIWTIDDFRRCQGDTGCIHFMIGRGALADPSLPWKIASELGLPRNGDNSPPKCPDSWHARISRLVEWTGRFPAEREQKLVGRIKQWLALAARHGDFTAFDDIKRASTVDELLRKLASSDTSTGPAATILDKATWNQTFTNASC